MAVLIFSLFVLFVLGLSFYLGNRAKSASGYFAAGGTVHWSVNGISFAGDYLSAASFLGICGLLATKGYDGFLYSIGFLAGWIVALFVVAEPMKRLGKYTFTDALDAKFSHKGIQLAAAISTLVVSLFYLIPQMVGAGALVVPLLGLPHYLGVIMVGVIVVFIVATAGMASTTYVQFLKGALLIVFSCVITAAMCMRGLSTTPQHGDKGRFYEYARLAVADGDGPIAPADSSYTVVARFNEAPDQTPLLKLEKEGVQSWFALVKTDDGEILHEAQWTYRDGNGDTIVNGAPESDDNQIRQVGNLEKIHGKTGEAATTGSLSPIGFLAAVCDKETVFRTWQVTPVEDGGTAVKVVAPKFYHGNTFMRPGLKFDTRSWDFISLMLALFFGTAALPHILIRYYTVPSPACARKSTIVAIASIGFFYVLTIYLGVGAAVNNVINPFSSNMSAPLLAQSFGTFLFAIISAIAFATVLGTVSGLIVAASGAIAHDLFDRYLGLEMTDSGKVMAGKISAVGVGVIGIALGILFKGMNVGFLVGWAFSVAASANLPAIMMLLFWKKTTARGVVASIIVGIVSALGIILLSPDIFEKLYGLSRDAAPIALNQPGIISIPLSFLTLVVVSLITQKPESAQSTPAAA